MPSYKLPDVDLFGKTAIVTGANTGIGKETARELLRRGGRVILACRDQTRGEEARDDITKDTGRHDAIVMTLDLGSLASVRAFADSFNQNESRLDLLVNNAGVFTKTRRETADGFEMMFGVNHLGHFLLTSLLLDKLKASAPSRIILVSSMAHSMGGKLDLKDLQYKRGYKSFTAYSRSKTANILHGVQLAKNLEGSGVTVYSLHPGTVRTEISRDYGNNPLRKLLYAFSWVYGDKALNPPEGARTTLYCCLEPAIATHSGRYYSKCHEKSAKSHATSTDTAQRFWELSEELCASVTTQP